MSRQFGKLTAAAMAAVAALSLLPSAAGADDLRAQRDRLQRQRDQLRVQINLAMASDTVVQAEDRRLSHQVTVQLSALAAARAAVAAADARAADARRRLAEIDASAGAAKRTLIARAVDLYEQPFESQALALTGAANLNDYAERQALVFAIQGKTSDLLDAYRQQHLDELAASKDLITAEADAEARRAVVQAQEDNLAAAKAAADQTHAALQRRIADLQFETRGLAEQEAALEARLAASEATVGGIPAAHGPLMWPVHGPVTREFGSQPGGFHPGIDIAPPFGTPIHASGTGVVIYAGWESGYGNYTCISHGGGIATCYAHQSAIYVHVGQAVVRGQVIGAEGSTGNSTGPHVHFEVRVNNVPQNPRRFVGGNP